FANQSNDRIAVLYGSSGASFQQGRQDGVLDPGEVKVADLNGDGSLDLAVANGGGNNVLVYLGLGDGQFGPVRQFFVGTDTRGVTGADVNGDGLLDLVVANSGSNDVSLLFGRGRDDAWTLTPGPRLRVGAGPVTTVVRDVTGDEIPDLLVANAQADTITLLR